MTALGPEARIPSPGKRPHRIVAILLAAGTSTRMGQPKLLLPLRGRPLLAYALGAVRGSAVARTVVVLGAAEEQVRSAVSLDGVDVVRNPDFADGMSTSIRAGVRASRSADAFLFVLGDAPFVTSRTVDALIRLWEPGGRGILVPTFRGRRGNPVLIDASLAKEIETLHGDTGFRALFPAHADDIREVDVDDPGVLVDIDTPEELAALEERLASGQPLRTVLTAWVEAAARRA